MHISGIINLLIVSPYTRVRPEKLIAAHISSFMETEGLLSSSHTLVSSFCMRYEVLAAVKMSILVFWVVTSYVLRSM
jgi:hypothetical protein